MTRMPALIKMRLLPIVLVVAVAAAGCVNEGPEYHVGAVGDDVEESAGDNDRFDGNDGWDGDQQLVLRATGDTEHAVAAGARVSLEVELITAEGAALEAEGVDFELVETTGDPGADLEAAASFTGEDGVASNELRVGDTPGELRAEATHPGADQSVDFHIDVYVAPPGDLQVGVEYDADELLELSGVELQLWETAQHDCLQFTPGFEPDVPVVDNAQLDSPEEAAMFEDLDVDNGYVVTAQGLGPEDQPAALGCVDQIELESDAVTDTTVSLSLSELSPTGDYDVLSVWDFTEALAAGGPVGQTIADTLDWVSDPAGMAADYLTDLAIDWVCDEYGDWSDECIAAMAAESSAEDEIADLLEDQLDSIDPLSDLLSIGEDIVGIVQHVTVESVLTIEGKPTGEGEVSGLDMWEAVIFDWGDGCDYDNSSDCDEIRIELDGDDFSALQAEWDGRFYDYDQLEIDPHEMVVPYGEFILHILEQHLLPALSGGDATTIAGAFDELLCSNLGGIDLFGISIDASTVQGFCNTAFTLGGIMAEDYLEGLEFDVGLHISGEGRMVDLDGSGAADLIDDGIFYGEIEVDDGDDAEMDAEFTADRIE